MSNIKRIDKKSLEMILDGEILIEHSVVIKFYGTHCHLCHALAPVYRSISDEHEDVLFYAYNMEHAGEEIESKYERYKYLCYSTASSSVQHPKFRLVFPLTKWIKKENIKHFWFALNKEIGDIADAQTKDLSRMYYIPSQYKNSFNFIFSHDGEVMDPDDLMVRHKYVLPAESIYDRFPDAIKKGLMEHNIMNRIVYKVGA